MSLVLQVKDQIKKAFDRIRDEKIKKNLLQAVPFWFASLITGIIAVIYSKLFLAAEHIAAWVFHFNSWLLFLVTPLCFATSWWTVKRFAPFARGSGIPQVMAAIDLAAPKTSHLADKLLGLRIIIVKVISSLIMAAGGGAIGREGPTIQIAASVFRIVNERLPAWMPKIAKQNVLVAGAAAGLAAAFNTPLGGIVFAIEELTKTHFSFYKTAIFSSVIIAGLTAQGLLGSYLYIGFPEISNTTPYIIFGVLLASLITGLSGSVMSRLILGVLNWKATLNADSKHLVYAVICGLLMAAIACLVSFDVMGSGKELMIRYLFTGDKYAAWYTPLLRVLGSILSFTAGGSGGIFAPALGAGAAIGSQVASWFQLGEANTNLLILAGMVGFLTGVTRSPFTSAILVLEMTDRHNVVFYLILAGLLAGMVSMLVDKHSFYHHLKNQYINELKDRKS
jgi:H+/Cl- antiporter ClcA